ncbi:unnamed protein product, partial [Vitis vinifera]
MPNEKDNDRESSITPRSMIRRSRTGRWHLNNSAGVVPLEVDSTETHLKFQFLKFEEV